MEHHVVLIPNGLKFTVCIPKTIVLQYLQSLRHEGDAQPPKTVHHILKMS